MLSVEDRDFLLSILALPRGVNFTAARFRADRLLAREIRSLSRLGSPSQRDFCIRLAGTPQLDNDCATAMQAAGEWLAAEAAMIEKAEPIKGATHALHPADRFE